MKKALLVIDAQEDFIGEQRNRNKFDYYDVDELIKNINKNIKRYAENGDTIIYISHVLESSYFNKKFYGYGISGSFGAKICEKIHIIGDSYFEKKKPNCFKNKNLVKFIKENSINEIEIVGIDVLNSICESARGALDFGLKVCILNQSIGTVNEKKYIKIINKLKNFGVAYI